MTLQDLIADLLAAGADLGGVLGAIGGSRHAAEVDAEGRIVRGAGRLVDAAGREVVDVEGGRAWLTLEVGRTWTGAVSWSGTTTDAAIARIGVDRWLLAPRDLDSLPARAVRRLAAEHAELARADKLASLGMLAAAMAHEINNPLAGVMACVRAVEDGTVPEGRRERYFATIHDAIDRIGQAVQSFLSFARHGAPGALPVDIRDVVDDCLTLLSPLLRRNRVRIVPEIPGAGMTVLANRGELTQALMNVLINAVHASPAQATVTLQGRRDDGRVIVEVRDLGVGIPAAVQERIWEPFYTTKPEGGGTGLGLSITRQVIESLGGHVALESAPDRGTLVTFDLPAAAPLQA